MIVPPGDHSQRLNVKSNLSVRSGTENKPGSIVFDIGIPYAPFLKAAGLSDHVRVKIIYIPPAIGQPGAVRNLHKRE